MANKITKVSKTDSNTSLTEKGLREKVDKFYQKLPQSFIEKGDGIVSREYTVRDTRIASEYNNRKLDEVLHLTSSGKAQTVVIEYKRGQITKEDVRECIFTRSYFDLCASNFDSFSSFVFVGESISREAKELIDKINSNIRETIDSHGCSASIRSVNYDGYVRRVYDYYREWANDMMAVKAIQSTAFSLYQELPEWFSLDWLMDELKSLD